MGGTIIVVLTAVLAVVRLGSAVFAFSGEGPSNAASKKRCHGGCRRSPAATVQARTAAGSPISSARNPSKHY